MAAGGERASESEVGEDRKPRAIFAGGFDDTVDLGLGRWGRSEC